MIIKTDEEGSKAITIVCDILSKFAGAQLVRGGLTIRKPSVDMLQTIGEVISSIKLIPKKSSKKEPKQVN